MICSRRGLLDAHQPTYLLHVVTGKTGNLCRSQAHRANYSKDFMLEERHKLSSICLSTTTSYMHHFAQPETNHYNSSVILLSLSTAVIRLTLTLPHFL